MRQRWEIGRKKKSRGAVKSTKPNASALGNRSKKDEPRSGDISSERSTRRCRRYAAHIVVPDCPNAYALGYVDCTAQRWLHRAPASRMSDLQCYAFGVSAPRVIRDALRRRLE